MNKEKIFADGFIIKPKHPNAPEFVKGSIAIKAEEAVAFIKEHKSERGWLTLDIKKSQKGKLYLELNTFQAKVGKSEGQEHPEEEEQESPDEAVEIDEDEEFNVDDIPFS